MPTDPALTKLIPAVVAYVTEHRGYVTKTKLLKLLYLFDVEYYRQHRKIFTGFDWKFLHLGPWTAQYDGILEDLVTQGALAECSGSRPEYDAKFYKAPEPPDLFSLFESYSEESILKAILDRWGECSTGEILDYVYFHTEPMEHGVRNQPLDFSRVSEQPPPAYIRRPSGKTRHEIEDARRKFLEGRSLGPALARMPSMGPRVNAPAGYSRERIDFTPPRYDEEFFAALAKLDRAQS